MNINLTLVRHGQSQGNVDESLYYTMPDHKIELTEIGQTQAIEVGKELSLKYTNQNKNVIIHSPWTRAKHTAQLISQQLKHYLMKEDPLIYEISIINSFSCMEVKEDFISDEKEAFSHYWHKTGTSENYADVYQRARIFYQDLVMNRQGLVDGDNVIVVSHGVFLLMLRGVIKNMSVETVLAEDWLRNCHTETHSINVLNF